MKKRLVGLIVPAAPGKDLRALPNVILAPHVGSNTSEANGRMADRALRGIKLSDTEKAKVKEVHKKYAAEEKSQREAMKPVMQEARTLRQKGDTAGLRALWDRNKAGRDQMQAFQVRQQADIRAALSPENQKLFDANVQEQAKRRAEWAKDGKGGKHGGTRGRGAKVG